MVASRSLFLSLAALFFGSALALPYYPSAGSEGSYGLQRRSGDGHLPIQPAPADNSQRIPGASHPNGPGPSLTSQDHLRMAGWHEGEARKHDQHATNAWAQNDHARAEHHEGEARKHRAKSAEHSRLARRANEHLPIQQAPADNSQRIPGASHPNGPGPSLTSQDHLRMAGWHEGEARKHDQHATNAWAQNDHARAEHHEGEARKHRAKSAEHSRLARRANEHLPIQQAPADNSQRIPGASHPNGPGPALTSQDHLRMAGWHEGEARKHDQHATNAWAQNDHARAEHHEGEARKHRAKSAEHSRQA